MKIGIPKEIKANEKRISLVPAGVAALVSAGHTVIMQEGAGLGSRFSDARYHAAGAQTTHDADAVWSASDLIVKVKEPIAPEWKRIKSGQIIIGGKITHKKVAEAFGLGYHAAESIVG